MRIGGKRGRQKVSNYIEDANRAITEAKYQLENNDSQLANYILRDLEIVKEAKLDDLSWAMDRQGCCENDVLALIFYIEEYIRRKENEGKIIS